MEERATFKFFRSFFEAAQELEMKSERADYYDAICNYVFNGAISELSGPPKAMFLLTKPNLDASLKKSQAGAIGGKATSKQRASKSEANSKQPVSEVGSRKKEVGSRKDTPLTPQGAKKQMREQAFEDFWALYPKKKSKGRAKTAWEKLKPSEETIRAIMEKLPLLIASEDWKKEGGQYIPYPASWLNAEGWNDEVRVSSSGQSNGYAVNGYTPGDSELRAIANLERLRDSLAEDGGA